MSGVPIFDMEPGYFGCFTRNQAVGAYPNGSRIKKVWCEKGDGTPLGTEGTVLGSMGHPELGIAYFVEWDNRPRHAVLVISKKLGVKDETKSNPRPALG